MNKHPFAGADYFKVLTTVTSEKDPSPSVDSTLISQNFTHFINKWFFSFLNLYNSEYSRFFKIFFLIFFIHFISLLKNDNERSNCTELMEEPFIKEYANKPLDLEFIENVINEIKTEVPKSN